MKMSPVTIGIIAIIGVLIAIPVISLFSAYGAGNRMEQNIKATYENNQAVLARVTTTIVETAQVPTMQAEDIERVITAALQNRYGENGARATFQAIQEQNPQIDSSLYAQIQRVIEAGRRDFQNSQTILVDQKRVYETALGSPWQGMWLRIAGYPRIDLSEYAVVTNARTEEAFQTKRDEPIQLR